MRTFKTFLDRSRLTVLANLGEDKEYRLGAGATKKKVFQLTWVNAKGKKVKNWVKQLSKTSFQVLKKDGMPREKSNKTTDNYEVIIPDKGFKLKSAVMNNTYAELELGK